ncbi:myo-inositol 2-dehydrogenase/D-chiro-inositol 1-dehydrogenase [Aequitasia blattaphilus]|uniref:Inositol 2-dehydrogenase/D-chiro-inositol 3-dehydrogenase n=1 Tax=Aequitasia blattaphilus TaxID=2949332 RepID=A0ABT1ECL8_9FIRM|nr:Gfo/Idh/MocA family oxidoreductase [Aequitasia blattaphilus]MCP1103572.1 Gfo/Idh/MocA family oxidoreductase [Aequitasia blattaphilus]MCR8616212.1 Gfo/Idh/MocA family oxidoreductase [Aequitasia blattaphilus]
MKELQVGLIGCGAIGRDHAQRIQNKLQRAKIVAVTDVIKESAQKVAQLCGCKVAETAEDIIADPKIDAVVVTAWDPAHKELVLECIKHKKFVFCEKPLATEAKGAKEIIKAEMEGGQRLVQVGFMRRYDKGYRQMKELIDAGEIGAPLLVHSAHRNVASGQGVTEDFMITQTCIHEIDLTKWLIQDDYDSVRCIVGRTSKEAPEGLRDPQMVMIRTKSGICIDIEVFLNARFGYDIQCQVVGENGTVNLPDPSYPPIRKEAFKGTSLCMDWSVRFIEAYDVELQEWIDNTLEGITSGPNSWDGYIAALTADLLIQSRDEGGTEIKLNTPERPVFYA